jgi:serine O-acetyltransferase
MTERIWYVSMWAYRRRLLPVARMLKLLNFVLFKTVLPYECVVGSDVTLWHRGLATVIHPNVTIGRKVVIAHGVTIGAGSATPDSAIRTTIEDGVRIGAGAVIVPAPGFSLRIGRWAHIGANSTVSRDVPAETKVRGEWPPRPRDRESV